MALKELLPESLRGPARRLRAAWRESARRRHARATHRRVRAERDERIRRYVAAHPVVKLQLGSGSNHLAGWLNTEGFEPSSFTHSLDIAEACVYLDVCERFPFADNTVDYIFHEHVMEHLTYPQGLQMLRECCRVLKPGGRLRTAMPDFAYFISLYAQPSDAALAHFTDEYVRFNSSVWSKDLVDVHDNKPVFVINHALRAWGHRFLYDYDTLCGALATAGFIAPIRCRPGESADSNLRGIEYRRELVGIADALIVESLKPRSPTAT